MNRTGTALALLLLGPAARADDGNYRPYLIGGRAGGMGGAFTALSDDPSGPYYNPAGIANVTRSQMSLSGSLFGVLRGTIKDALGDGLDFSFSDLQTFPIQTSAIYKFGDAPQALALSIFVPDSFDRDDRDDIGNPKFSFFNSDKQDTVWAGLTYARRFGNVSVGASGFVLAGTAKQ